MSQFKKGDRVINLAGRTGIIAEVTEGARYPYRVMLDDGSQGIYAAAELKEAVVKVTAGKPEFYYCASTDLHPYGELIQVYTRLENPPCPYCGGIMTYGKYW
jgi:hypothetical protein